MKAMHGAVLAALAGGLVGSAQAQHILMTELNSDTIYKYNPTTNVMTPLFTYADPDVRLAGITRGPSGAFYVANGPLPIQDPSTATIFRIQGLLGGAPVSSVFAKDDPLQNPIGLVYHPASHNLLAVNNPPEGEMSQAAFDGILGYHLGSGAMTQVFTQPSKNDPPPAYRQGARIIVDPSGAGDFIATSLNGGAHDAGGGDMAKGSTLWRFNVDGSLNSSASLLVDLSFVTASPITFVRGVTAGPSGELYITDGGTETLYRIDLDGAGNYAGIAPVTSIAAGSGMLDVIYHPGSNKLFFSTSLSDELYSVNLDGSGLSLVASNFEARNFFLVPAPGSLALIGLGVLATLRRRR
ncbi:MAG: PEP-CTERM sorting domain-containing protein [Phycisphaeraceae bacterium]|nr:PEP-CTERM sorting domain-containing protein [Phycisphaeraceae bacterium]